MMTKLAATVLFISFITIVTGCVYRMPEQDEFSLIPATNNPNYTREKANPTPGIGY
jgi:hypothetical protein